MSWHSAVDLGHQEYLLAVAVAQRLAHAHFAVAAVVVPAVVHEVDAIVHGRADDLDAFGLAGIANVIPAEADHRNLLQCVTQRSRRNTGRIRSLREVTELGKGAGGGSTF